MGSILEHRHTCLCCDLTEGGVGFTLPAFAAMPIAATSEEVTGLTFPLLVCFANWCLHQAEASFRWQVIERKMALLAPWHLGSQAQTLPFRLRVPCLLIDAGNLIILQLLTDFAADDALQKDRRIYSSQSGKTHKVGFEF